MPDRKSQLWYDFCYSVSALGMTLAFSLRTEGFRNVPASGPCLLVSNHQSYLDTVAIGLAARRPLCYLARKTLFRNRFFRLLIESLNAVPINQEGFAREGLRTILEQLQAGRAVLIFPEGGRTADGKLHPLRPGIHLLIKRVDMTIVPVGIAGAYDAWPSSQRLPTPAPLFVPKAQGNIAVCIGAATSSRQFADLPREEVLCELFNKIGKCKERAEKMRHQ
jgi:1-acyl-sn-glycerol-3-phosphate acyltransferase